MAFIKWKLPALIEVARVMTVIYPKIINTGLKVENQLFACSVASLCSIALMVYLFPSDFWKAERATCLSISMVAVCFSRDTSAPVTCGTINRLLLTAASQFLQVIPEIL